MPHRDASLWPHMYNAFYFGRWQVLYVALCLTSWLGLERDTDVAWVLDEKMNTTCVCTGEQSWTQEVSLAQRLLSSVQHAALKLVSGSYFWFNGNKQTRNLAEIYLSEKNPQITSIQAASNLNAKTQVVFILSYFPKWQQISEFSQKCWTLQHQLVSICHSSLVWVKLLCNSCNRIYI